MRNSIQIQAKKWSHTLGLVVIIYATIGTILSVKFQVNLMAYTTPIIVGFCGMTVVFACTKRFLYKMLLQDGNILFFDTCILYSKIYKISRWFYQKQRFL